MFAQETHSQPNEQFFLKQVVIQLSFVLLQFIYDLFAEMAATTVSNELSSFEM